MTSVHYEKKPLNIKTYTILQNGNKHLNKSKNLFFHDKRNVITLKDDFFFDAPLKNWRGGVLKKEKKKRAPPPPPPRVK